MSTIPQTAIKDLLTLDPAMQVLSFTGRVKSVFKASSGTNSVGAYHIQNVVIQDNGSEIKIKLDGLEPWPDTYKGRRVTVQATKHQDKYIGIRLKDEVYKNQPQRVVTVNTAAIVDLEGINSAPAPGAPTTPAGAVLTAEELKQKKIADLRAQIEAEEKKPVAPPPPPPQEQQTSEKKEDRTSDLKRALAGMMNMEWEIIKAADIVNLAYMEIHQEPLSESHYTGMIGRMFIECGKSGMFASSMPTKLNPSLAAAAEKKSKS